MFANPLRSSEAAVEFGEGQADVGGAAVRAGHGPLAGREVRGEAGHLFRGERVIRFDRRAAGGAGDDFVMRAFGRSLLAQGREEVF